MTVADTDTIFAVASGAGQAAVAVLRISGPASGLVLEAIGRPRPVARRASLRRLRNRSGEVLDEALVLWLPRPGSYTGEDSGELHLHGGRAVVDGVMGELLDRGLRPAEPGEFTRRAFFNGRLGLVEAEAVHDLVTAETAAQRRQAIRQLSGELGAIYHGWAARLRRLLAHQEALIEFPDEDLPTGIEAGIASEVVALHRDISAHLADGRRGERLRDGLVFAIVGAPNVGKSSLLNALVGYDAAIVSPVPGTTRDVVQARGEFGGVPVTLVDTAGLRESHDPIEQEGMRRARAQAERADLVIAVADHPGRFAADDVGASTGACEAGQGPRRLHVRSKSDLSGDMDGAGHLAISVLTEHGMGALRRRLAEEARALTAGGGSPPLTRARHRAALSEAASRLAAAAGAPMPELLAEDLRLAVRALGRITGAVAVDDVLDTIFAEFCLGK